MTSEYLEDIIFDYPIQKRKLKHSLKRIEKYLKRIKKLENELSILKESNG